MSDAKTAMELKEEDIRKHYSAAHTALSEIDHAPRYAEAVAPKAAAAPSSTTYVRRRLRSTVPGISPALSERRPAEHGSLIETVAAIEDDDPLPSEVQNHVLRVLRRGIAIGHAIVDLYGDITALNKLKEANLVGDLNAAKAAEFTDLLASSAAVGLFATASYVTFMLADYMVEAENEAVTADDPEEIVLENPLIAIKGALWELDQQIESKADGDAALVKLVRDYFAKLAGELTLRKDGLKYLEAFLARSYRVEADDFTIDGFAQPRLARSTAVVMDFKRPDQVVGNHIAKYQCMKLAKMLMAYDFERQLNPFVDLGGFIFTFIGDGKPGTGKTLLIQMTGGLLHEYCTNAGYPFRYQNLSMDNVDSYQGKSGQNAKAFIQNVMDPRVIGFGTIDDIDQIAGKRGDRQSSAGQQEITAVLMESFAGANTVVRGNCAFGMFSNYPENVDDALRQRAGARYLVDGPQSREDYIDILSLLLGKRHSINLGKHDLFATQDIRRVIDHSYEAHNEPASEKLRAVFEQVKKDVGKLDTIAKIGTYLDAIQDMEERFTGRAIKNITDAAKLRAMDFEIPDEWMEKPDLFLFKDYETKKAMIAELMGEITPAMLIQEINRYADSEFRYAGSSDEAAVNTMVREMRLREMATRRYADKRSAGDGGGEP
ncbi:MAG: ATP-binding protein [Alphaproteobacteria bacterium]|nr:ATP-binding protein [Alphaproteobacteria bacterium]